jgi:hypothetical protein
MPAVMSTTAVTAGLATIELVKLAKAAAAWAEWEDRKEGTFKPFRLLKTKLDFLNMIFRRIKRNIIKLVPLHVRSFVSLYPPLLSTLELKRSQCIRGVGKVPLNHLRSTFVNLATPSLSSAEPIQASTTEITSTGELFSKWDVVWVSIIAISLVIFT